MNTNKIGLVPYDSLGDSLVYLLLAANLQRNGYQISYYNKCVSQLADWFPWMNVQSLNTLGDLECAHRDNDLVLMDPPPFVKRDMAKNFDSYRERYVMINERLPEAWQTDLGAQYDNPALKILASASGSMKGRYKGDLTILELHMNYMRERMGLENVTLEVPFTPPAGAQKKRHNKRVAIFPFSLVDKKCWSAKGFIKVYRSLEKAGYQPICIVAPNELERWNQQSGNFPCKGDFASLSELAVFLYESAVVLANDSGGGHLASLLGVPTVTVYKRKRTVFPWRPCYAPGKVVTPLFSINILRKRYWRPFLRPSKVLQAVESFL